MCEWKRLGHKDGFGFVDSEGVPLVSARVRTGVIRSAGEVTMRAGPDERVAIVAALLGRGRCRKHRRGRFLNGASRLSVA
jgi:hypothetical protein